MDWQAGQGVPFKYLHVKTSEVEAVLAMAIS